VSDLVNDDNLEAALRDLATQLNIPERSLWLRIEAGIQQTPSRRSRTRLVLAALAVLVVLVVLVVAIVSIAPAREAVADLFGIGATEITRADNPRARDAAPPLQSTGDEDSLRRKLAAAGLRLPDAALVGAAREWRVAPQGETIVAYDAIVFGQRAAGRLPALKRVPETGSISWVQVGSETGAWIEGGHTRSIGGRTVHSESALLWVDDGLELRLEGDRPLTEMLAIARSVRPVD
jgi:hypothetical protein